MRKSYSVSVLALCFLAMLMCSCTDMGMARELAGKWETNYITAHSDGEKDSITETLSFVYDEDSSDDDGTFTESLNCQTNEMSEEEYLYSLHYKSVVSGRYEVVGGDLFLKYDLATLEVIIKEDDVKLRAKNLSAALGIIGEFVTTLEDPKHEFVEECREVIYASLFKLYKYNSSDDVAFQDLQIEGRRMSFKHEDGTMKYVKIQ